MTERLASFLKVHDVIERDGIDVRIETLRYTASGVVVIEVQSNNPAGPTGRWEYMLPPDELVVIK